MRVAVFVLVVCGIAAGNIAFDEWTKEHGKIYQSWEERQYRQDIWMKNLKMIMAHNVQHKKGEKNYEMGMNAYGDMTSEEFKRKTCFRASNSTDNLMIPKIHYKGSEFLAPNGNYTLADSVDYRELGYVTKVKDQGQCGSCWAFSTTGSLEGQIFRKTGKLISLSEQQLVDCAGKFGNFGCDGGLMDSAFNYIMSTKGLESEASYPYTAEDDECTYDKTKAVAGAKGFIDIPAGSEDMLTLALAQNGPIAVAIDASQDSFQFYSKGVYDEPNCSPTELDHGVLAVGFGTLKGTDYYIVKNSWGSSWGMDGYILMSRNGKNQCGIASSASYPLV